MTGYGRKQTLISSNFPWSERPLLKKADIIFLFFFQGESRFNMHLRRIRVKHAFRVFASENGFVPNLSHGVLKIRQNQAIPSY